MSLTERQSSLKETFVQARGYWLGAWKRPRGRSRNFFQVYFDLSAVPWRRGDSIRR